MKVCNFHVSSARFFGFIVEWGQLKANPEKIRAIVDWPVPENRRKLQRFLRFTNFYGRFIQNYGVVSPLTRLTSTKLCFDPSPVAQATFNNLKTLFSSAPLLIHSDPELQFIMEVNTSDSGVGAVLSQHSPSDQKLHPCGTESCWR